MTITYSESVGPLAGANISTIDQKGNLWGALHYQEAVLKFAPDFTPLVNVNLYPFDGTPDDPGFQDTGRKTGVMSIDPSGNLWFASNFSLNFNTGFEDNPSGAIFELDPNGKVLSGAYGYTRGGVYNP
jgi:sugar lactone lactonase YvrE